MTPAEHLAAAEDGLAQVSYQGAVAGGQGAAVVMLWVLAHELAALVVELGVPTVQHVTMTPAPTGAGSASPLSTG